MPLPCPYCGFELFEQSQECPECHLTLKRAEGILGPVPQFAARVGDRAAVIDARQRRILTDRIAHLEWRFPQIRIQIACDHFPEDHPLSLYVFRLFNSGHLSGEHEKSGLNRLILIVLDPLSARSAAMVGYGLEPFISREELDALLAIAEPSWEAGDWAGGLRLILEALDTTLENAATAAARAFGSPLHPARDSFEGY
ncbi:MAG: hypothetical protein MUF31_00375 [Akkermansiaceae bacterium]|jgi:uncharacterized membrane protein YgcG|nr:hypothetical protein [Akkermansiaceae bacterium]